jgi:Bacteriophage HK97-gp10, putative tail-component
LSAKNFRKELEALDRKVRNKIIKKAQKDALKELAAKIRQDAPVDSGELRSSIKIKVGPRKKDHIVTVINISTPDDNPHAARVELAHVWGPATRAGGSCTQKRLVFQSRRIG